MCSAGCACRATSTTARSPTGASWPRTWSASTAPRRAPSERRASGIARRSRDRAAAGARCARTRATVAPIARSTRAGPSDTSGCCANATRSQPRMEGRTDSLGRAFDRICALLTDRGYLSGDDDDRRPGTSSSRIWSDSDLVVAECLRTGVWDGLEPAELAAVVSSLVYEPRRDERLIERMPTRRRARRRRRHGSHLGRAGRRRDGAGSGSKPRAAARLRLAGVPVGPARQPRPGARRDRRTRDRRCRPATSSAGASS